MSLFRKHKSVLPPLLSEADFDEVANYSSAVAYLEGLSIEEYAKVLKVVAICRKANEECAEALGEKLEPTTFINPPAEPTDTPEPDFLDELSDKPKKTTKIKVNQ